MATKIRKFQHIIDNNSVCLGDTAPISGHSRGLCESANLTVQLKFVPVSWYDGSANLMASFKCSTLSHPTGDRLYWENRVSNGQTLIPNELDLNFWVRVYGAKFHQNWHQNWELRPWERWQTYRHTGAGELIICPMLCYSKGTDKYQNLVATASSVRRLKLFIVLNSW